MDFRQNPFYILGATTRDNKHKILSLAEEKSLSIAPDVCNKAKLDLINPRNRLSAEVAWLPGVSPHRAIKLIKSVAQKPSSVREHKNISPLSLANLILFALSKIRTEWKSELLAKWINWLATVFEEIDPDIVLRDINEDRTISGLPEVKTIELIKNEINTRRKYIRSSIKNIFKSLPTETMIRTVTKFVEFSTKNGEKQAPIIIDDLVDTYQIEVQSYIEQESENIKAFLIKIKDKSALERGEEVVMRLIERLEVTVRNWDKVAQPIQLSSMSRGIEHDASNTLAGMLRSYAIYIYNEYGYLDSAKRITNMLNEVFAEVPEITEVLEKDLNAIEDLVQKGKKAEKNYQKWVEEISYSTKVGSWIKAPLWISADSVGFDNKSFALEEISRVRWGGVREQKGLFSSTRYTVRFGDYHELVSFNTTDSNIYTEFISKLWMAVCVRILTDMVHGLANGDTFNFGDAILHDSGMELLRHRFIGADERVFKKWTEIAIGNGPGYFSISCPDDKKAYAALSYMDTDNIHILEAAVRIYWKNPRTQNLSSIITG